MSSWARCPCRRRPGGGGENYLQHAEHYYRIIATAQALQTAQQQQMQGLPVTVEVDDADEDDFDNALTDRFTSASPQSFQPQPEPGAAQPGNGGQPQQNGQPREGRGERFDRGEGAISAARRTASAARAATGIATPGGRVPPRAPALQCRAAMLRARSAAGRGRGPARARLKASARRAMIVSATAADRFRDRRDRRDGENRGENRSESRFERAAKRPERGERPERPERPERGERFERLQGSEPAAISGFLPSSRSRAAPHPSGGRGSTHQHGCGRDGVKRRAPRRKPRAEAAENITEE